MNNEHSNPEHDESEWSNWTEQVATEPEPEQSSSAASPQEKDGDLSFMALSTRLGENLAAATLKLVDAAQDFTGLIQAYVSAGQQLERSLEIVRELANASQRALNDAREAAQAAEASAGEAKQAQQSSVDLIQRSTNEHLALAELTDNLRQRISALSVLGAPMPRREDDGRQDAA
jgi:hypothetical protein